ncbi:MAG: SDR family oxidoreductase [Halobacteriovoraceae bacterium]|nr:SDR family oxidoreductase [Halobacteriovoraceae bacterium]MCB9095247.1 SDR family oxidoreductase [Halobacteriovoraceae bacterium]
MQTHNPKQTILITGSSGYIGSQVVEKLCLDTRVEHIIGIDVRETQIKPNHQFEFHSYDIRDPQLANFIKDKKVDTVIHLASIVTPGKNSNRQFEYSVDVEGTRNILNACIQGDVKKIIITSSGAAYGYHPDNPTWIKETDPLRGNREFAYSDHKRIVEEMLSQFRQDHPQLKQLIFRPGTIIGESVNNQITNLFKNKIIIGINGSKSPFNFIWDQDVINCLVEGVFSNKMGTYNLAGDGYLTLRDIAKILNKPFISLPQPLIRFALKILKTFGLSPYGPEQTIFLAYRPVLANDKLKNEFGYTPHKDSLETFQFYKEKQFGEKTL